MDLSKLKAKEVRELEDSQLVETERDLRRKLAEARIDVFSQAGAKSGLRRGLRRGLARVLTERQQRKQEMA